MSLFSKIKKAWSEGDQPLMSVPEELINLPEPRILGQCACCNKNVREGDKIRHFDNKIYHIKCFRKNKKLAIKAYLG